MKTFFLVRGKVKTGAKRGKKLGFPTANISLHKQIPEGIYASTVKIGNQTYHATTFIGASKTFNQTDVKLESYILDFNENIYGKWISVKIYKKLRGNKKFESAELLIEQIKEDVKQTRAFLAAELGFEPK